MGARLTGVVINWHDDRGFGFIKADEGGPDLFLHAARMLDTPAQGCVVVEDSPHGVEAGADAFLMPSRYEPCGLNQMYSLRYGTIPIVRATGGLDDTVRHLSEPLGNGIKFNDSLPDALAWAMNKALELYANPDWLRQVQRHGMSEDFSWNLSAEKYERLYRRITQ